MICCEMLWQMHHQRAHYQMYDLMAVTIKIVSWYHVTCIIFLNCTRLAIYGCDTLVPHTMFIVIMVGRQLICNA